MRRLALAAPTVALAATLLAMPAMAKDNPETGFDTVDFYHISAAPDGGIDGFTLTAGLFRDLPLDDSRPAYPGAVGGNSTDLTAVDKSGLNIPLNPSTALVPSYRYPLINNSEKGFDDMITHIYRLGLRYGF